MLKHLKHQIFHQETNNMTDTEHADFLQNVLNSDDIKNFNKTWVYIILIYYNIIINNFKYFLIYQEINNDEKDLENDDNNEINEYETEDNNMKTE